MGKLKLTELFVDIQKAYYNLLFTPRFPLGMTIYLTNACNLHCNFCEIGQQNTLQKSQINSIELTKDSIDKIISLCKQVGIKRLYITGGEPFNSKNIWHLLEQCIYHNLIIDDITTNGTFLYKFNDYEISLINKVVRDIIISIDSANESEHDKMRGVNGTFHQIQSFFLDNLKHAKFKNTFSFNVLVHSKNYLTLKEIINLAISWKIKHINFQPLSPNTIFPDKVSLLDKNDYIKDLDINQFIDEISQLSIYCRNKNLSTNLSVFKLWASTYFTHLNSQKTFFYQLPIKIICSKVFNYIHIDYRGNFLPCINLKPIANTNDKDLFIKWQKDAQKLKIFFLNKGYFKECNYCYCDFPINLRLSLIYFPISNIKYISKLIGYYLKRIFK